MKEALAQMLHPLTASRPNNTPALFYKRFWDQIGDEVVYTCLDILNGEGDPTGMNKTFTVLIPKVKNPVKGSEFRPITLCNVLFKFVTKTISNRLKKILLDIVGEN